MFQAAVGVGPQDVSAGTAVERQDRAFPEMVAQEPVVVSSVDLLRRVDYSVPARAGDGRPPGPGQRVEIRVSADQLNLYRLRRWTLGIWANARSSTGDVVGSGIRPGVARP